MRRRNHLVLGSSPSHSTPLAPLENSCPRTKSLVRYSLLVMTCTFGAIFLVVTSWTKSAWYLFLDPGEFGYQSRLKSSWWRRDMILRSNHRSNHCSKVTLLLPSDPHSLEIYCLINGVQKQRAKTNLMLFDIPTLIEYTTKWVEGGGR